MDLSRTCYQINLAQSLGGGAVYTQFFSKTLGNMDWKVVLFIHEKATFWSTLNIPGATFIRVRGQHEILERLPGERSLFVTHTTTTGSLAQTLRERHLFAAFAHMPMYGRRPDAFDLYHQVLPVSRYVLDSLRSLNISHCYPHPLLGMADPERLKTDGDTNVISHSPYDWDRRKGRDRLLRLIYPFYRKLAPARYFSKKEGLTLGIVSGITPIKQFPLLFEHIAPAIRKFPEVNIEIFGSGGYASVRDLKHSLRPLKDQVRFWGQQDDVARLYPLLDFLLTGLPEKEALGLNVIESQYCGTPVLAVNAPPFTETVADGETGFLYTDPRLDRGQNFEQLLRRITAMQDRPDPRRASEHLAQFSPAAFRARVEKALDYLMNDCAPSRRIPTHV